MPTHQTPMKVLVIGSVNGKYDAFLKKLQTFTSKIGFTMCLAIGDFFGADQDNFSIDTLFQDGKTPVIPTYIVSGDHVLPKKILHAANRNGGMIVDNLIHLGTRGIFSTSEGLTIAYLGGNYVAPSANGTSGETAEIADAQLHISPTSQYTKSDVHFLLNHAKSLSRSQYGVDILITHEWPSSIAKNSTQSFALSPECGSDQVDKLVKTLQPRYCFASKGNKFYEREPFVNVGVDINGVTMRALHVTRFLGLGQFGSKGERFHYAMNIIPMVHSDAETLSVQPPNTTSSPFSGKRALEDDTNDYRFEKRPRPDESKQPNGSVKEPPSGYICKICNEPGHFVRDCPNKQQRRGPPDTYICKICNEKGHWIQDCPEKQHREPHHKRERERDRERGKRSGPPETYTCNICHEKGHWIQDCPSKTSQPPRQPHRHREEDDACWFCLSNPKVLSELLLSIGDQSYLSLAKGPLVENNALIIPISHFSTSRHMMRTGQEGLQEVIQVRNRVQSAVQDRSSGGQYAIFYEVFGGFTRFRNEQTTHYCEQIVPIPSDISEETVLEEFTNRCGEYGWKVLKTVDGKTFDEMKEDPLEGAELSDPFFRLTTPSTTIVFIPSMTPSTTPTSANAEHRDQELRARGPSIIVGRALLSEILGVPDRKNWRDCVQTPEEESREVERAKAFYAGVYE